VVAAPPSADPQVHRPSLHLRWRLPASGVGLILLSIWPEPPLNEFNDIIFGSIWFGATLAAYIFARQRRYADHRRWMLRSFAITASFPITLILFIPLGWILQGDAHSQFSASSADFEELRSGLDTWLSAVIPILAVEWWIDREPAAPEAAGAA